jgi:transposase-like protein
MEHKVNEPKTLQEAITYFSDPNNCLSYLVPRLWPHGVKCPACGRKDPVFLATQRRWQCKSVHPKRQFSAKVGTVFEDSAITLEKWLPAVWMLVNDKNGISSYELAKALGVTQKTAWFMLHRVRLGLTGRTDRFGTPKIGNGEGGSGVEVDETFVGGKLANMHKDRRARFAAEGGHTGGSTGKTIVIGMLDRDLREVRAKIVPNVKRETLQNEVLREVKYGSRVYTDEWVGYDNLHYRFVHDVVNKMEGYVSGQVHVNGIENFWSLLKRTLKGTYVAVEPFHLQRYADEQVFRFNNRGGKKKEERITDAERFSKALTQIVGKRLTYAELTGKVGETTPF